MRGLAYLMVAAGLVLAAAIPPAAAQSWREQVDAIHAAVAPYRDVERAKAAGWRRATRYVPLMGEHWSLGRKSPDYVSGEAIDFTKPSNLIYARIGGRHELVAVAYVVRIGANEPLPEGFSGTDDRWHVHNVDQILAAVGEVRPLAANLGRSLVNRRYAGDGRRRLAMVHVWLDGRNPQGTFENLDPTLPYRQFGLPASAWNGAPLDAARGLALALPDGCADELDGKLRLAGVSFRRKREISKLCNAYAKYVRENLVLPPDALNSAATAAWREFDARLTMMLEPAEIARIAALVEGTSGVCMTQ